MLPVEFKTYPDILAFTFLVGVLGIVLWEVSKSYRAYRKDRHYTWVTSYERDEAAAIIKEVRDFLLFRDLDSNVDFVAAQHNNGWPFFRIRVPNDLIKAEGLDSSIEIFRRNIHKKMGEIKND